MSSLALDRRAPSVITGKPRLAGLMLLLAVISAGCAQGPAGSTGAPSANASAPSASVSVPSTSVSAPSAAPTSSALDDTRWVLVEAKGTPVSRLLTVKFSATGMLGGEDSCNSWSGYWTSTNDELHVENVFETAGGCMGDNGAGHGLEMFQSATHFLINGDKLALSDSSGTASYVFLEQTGIVYTKWTLTSIGEPPVPVDTGDARSLLSFGISLPGKDARIVLSDLCGGGAGQYTTEWQVVSIRNVVDSVSSKCEGSNAKLHVDYRDALTKASTWSIDASSPGLWALRLAAQDGHLLLTFSAPHAVAPTPAPGEKDANASLKTPTVTTPLDAVSGELLGKGMGSKAVALRIAEDYQSPASKTFVETVLPKLIDKYARTGNVMIIFYHPALASSESLLATVSADCAGSQNRYWQFRDWLFANQGGKPDSGAFTRDRMFAIASRIGLNRTLLSGCLDNPTYGSGIEANEASLTKSLGSADIPAAFINGTRVDGPLTFENISKALDAAIAAGSTPKPRT